MLSASMKATPHGRSEVCQRHGVACIIHSDFMALGDTLQPGQRTTVDSNSLAPDVPAAY